MSDANYNDLSQGTEESGLNAKQSPLSTVGYCVNFRLEWMRVTAEIQTTWSLQLWYFGTFGCHLQLTATEVMEVGCLACRDFVSTSTALHFFWGGDGGSQVPCSIFWEGGYSSVAILIFTSHKPIAWNRLLTNSFVSFTQSFCFTVKIIFRRKHNQVSNTLID